ncbi:IBR domain containing protein, partial [Trifolium medium]|nr:IBR domain containing protein [Trifolium medium]
MDSTEDLHFLLTAQRHELTAAESMESDLDFAYRLQLQEALAASLTNHPSSSTDVIFEEPIIDDAVFNATSLQLKELEKMETEMHDREQ